MSNKKWNKDLVIECFKTAYKEVLYDEIYCNVSYRQMYKKYNYLPSRTLISKYFTNISNLLDECNIITMKNQPEKYLLHVLEVFIEKNGYIPCETDFNKTNDGYPEHRTFIKYFGNINNALIRLGYNDNLKNNHYEKYTDEELLHILKMELDKNPKIKRMEFDKLENTPSVNTYNKRFNGWDNARILAGHKPIYMTKEFIISELHRYVREFNTMPISKDFNKLKGYPSYPTIVQYIGNLNNTLIDIGYGDFEFIINNNRRTTLNKEKQYEDMSPEIKKEYLINELNRYINEFNKTPTKEEIQANLDYPNPAMFRNVFGSYNKALEYAGIEYNSVTEYDDDFLKQEFFRFVNENGRIPYSKELKKEDGFPSNWVYVKRFGSWNKTVEYYGFSPILSKAKKYKLNNGEVCSSSYEFVISNWLLNNNVKYERDFLYSKINSKYKGRMNCDYKILNNDKIIYIEMAGLYPEGRKKVNKTQNNYMNKIYKKIELLQEAKVDYLIIYPDDIRSNSLENIFSFLKLN